MWELFEMAQSQGIPGGAGGIVGLSHVSVSWYMDLLGIPEEARRDTFELFRAVEHRYIRFCNRNLKPKGPEAPASE